MSYCIKCGNTGINIDGDVCECRVNVKSFYDTVSCLDIPEQYRGIAFNSILVPKDLHESYAKYLQSVYDSVLTGKWRQHNVVIASPIGHSKTILAYSCIEVMFRAGIPTFPVYDILELKRMLLDMDLCRKSLYNIDEPELIVTAPILFVKIPRMSNWEIYDTIAMLLDRRVRRGNSTIFLYDGSWNQLTYGDKNNILTGLVGDGNYNTIEVKSWFVSSEPTIEKEITLPDNIG
jgi:hypothetical protein